MKLLLLLAFVIALFISGWGGLLLFAGLLVGLYVAAEISFRMAVRGLKPVLIILTFTFLANALTFSALPAGEAALVQMGPFMVPETVSWIGTFGVKPLGALNGLFFALRIVLLICMTSLLTYTTSIVALTDAFVRLMRPLAKLRVPTEDIATMFSIALRFIPITAEEAERIMVSQSARGAVFNQGGPIKRVKAWFPVMVPLFVSLFRRADEIASAMETRCYTGKGRTHLREHKLDEIDLAVGVIGTLALIILGILL
jgi:energy-coupling factor transport system permease protein